MKSISSKLPTIKLEYCYTFVKNIALLACRVHENRKKTLPFFKTIAADNTPWEVKVETNAQIVFTKQNSHKMVNRDHFKE